MAKETMNSTKIRLKLIKDNEAKRVKILGLENKISAQSNHIDELEAQVSKWELMQSQGYTAVVMQDDMIVSMVNVAPRSKFIYTQEIPKEIGTALYDAIRFYTLDSNGSVVKDNQKYARYISI